MSLTEADAAAFRHAKIAQVCMEAAEAAVRRDEIALEGTVTLSCSAGVAQFALSRVLPRFLAENPRVPPRLQASDGFADMIGDGIELAIGDMSGCCPTPG